MTTIAHHERRPVTGGVDTHKDLHVAAVLDELGRLLATGSFPTTRHGYRRQLRIARSGAMKARTAAANQLHSLCDTAPDPIRAQLAGRTLRKKVAVAERWRPGSQPSAEAAAKRALATVARRWRSLDDEARELSRHIKAILDDVAPELIARYGVGYETAGQLLVTAGDNPDRLRHEQSFAALCGASPVQASSGRTNRHRLNRGGDRHANSALWTIVLVRMTGHAPTKAYVERRTTQGLSKPEIMRCLKRYVARELFPLVQAITHPPLEEGETANSEIAA